MHLPIAPTSERPFCFGKEYIRASTACLGGLDLDYVDEDGSNIRPPCSCAHDCRDAMGTNKPTPLPWTDMVVPQHGMRRLNIDGPRPDSPNFIPPERPRMFQRTAPIGPVTAQSTMPFLIESAMPAQPAPAPVVTPPPATRALPQPNTPEFTAMIERLNAAGRRADEQAAALRAQQAPPPAPAPVMAAPPPIRPVMPQQPQQPQPVQQQAPPLRPSFLDRVSRPAAAIVQAVAPLPAPLSPQPQQQMGPQAVQYPVQVYGAAPTYQLNYGLPGYLTAAEPRHPGESLWSVLGREVLRAVGKAIGHAFAHFFDTRVLRPA